MAYGQPYNQQAYTGVQVGVVGGVQQQQQGGFGVAPPAQQIGGWAQPPPYGVQAGQASTAPPSYAQAQNYDPISKY